MPSLVVMQPLAGKEFGAKTAAISSIKDLVGLLNWNNAGTLPKV